MKSLLIKLTVGLSEQDVHPQELKTISQWLAKKYITKKENIYKFHSKYRAGTIGLVQNATAYLHVIGELTKNLFIGEGNLHGAKEGDLVILQRILGKRGTPSGVVAEIVGRAVSYSVAYVDSTKALVDIKTDFKIEVNLQQKELETFNINDVFQINNQDNSIMQKLGNLQDPHVDEKIVLAQFNKHDKFSKEILEQATSFSDVDASLYPDRKDLRELNFCTIDPVSAKDFDDAIFWDEQNQTLYVAIADVSEYVKPFGEIDNEAIYRGFSTYLPHRSIPMLPRQLSETLCSLQPHVDRLAYVFEMKLKNFEVVSSKVYEAIIHSKRRFTYEEIDDFLSNKLKAKNNVEEQIFKDLTNLKKVTDKLREKRLQIGFDFRSKELEMKLDENSNIISTDFAQETPSHSLIEDCMLLANKESAKRFTKGVFRIHEPPSQVKLQKLYQELASIGLFIEIKDTIKETITAIQKQAKQMNLESEVDTLIIRSQMQARYSPLNAGHFGLGFEEYTHFTSPIRRYSDLIVHRLLKAIAKNDKDEGSYVLRNIESMCITISEKERESSGIEVEFMTRKFTRWAEQNIDKTFNAKVISTDPELKVEIEDKISGAKVFITSHAEVVLFEKVKVKITKTDIAKAKIFGEIVDV